MYKVIYQPIDLNSVSIIQSKITDLNLKCYPPTLFRKSKSVEQGILFACLRIVSVT